MANTKGKKTYDPLYKFDKRESVRVWYMEQDGSQYRTWDGIHGGTVKHSGWSTAKATNVGRANERDPVAQATFEIEAQYEKQLTREYHRTIKGAEGGAHYFMPMLAQKYKKYEPCFVQPKLNGIRCIAKADGLWSRKGKPLLGAAHIHELLKPVFAKYPDLIKDGELYNHAYKEEFETIVSAVRKEAASEEQRELAKKIVQYHVYDLPSAGHLPFSERTKQLRAIVEEFKELSSHLLYVETHWTNTEEEADRHYERWMQDLYEGSIHRLDKPYEQCRTKSLLKRKDFEDQEFPISRILEGDGNWAGYAKMVEFILPGDKRNEKGERPKAGIAGNQEFTRDLLLTGMTRYKMVTVRFKGYTKYGMPYIPVAINWHGAERED